MRLTIVQSDILWENKLSNLQKLGEMMKSVPTGTDILILPEMFNTGFSMRPDKLAEPPLSTTFEWMRNIAVTNNLGVCGSYIIKSTGNYYNSWIFVSPDDKIYTYNKRHLFSPGNEHKLFTRGTERLIFNFRGIRICPNICYDLRFPVWSRNRSDYDLLINSANWPATRRDVWLTLLKARAIENQCFVAAANRIGIDGEGISYCGDSLVAGPKGEIIAEAGREESLLSAEISLDNLEKFRMSFPMLNDADKFEIKF